MASRRTQTLVLTLAGLALIWLMALLGFALFRYTKVTADKVLAFVQTHDPSALDPASRANALRELAAMMNQLSVEERRRARFHGDWDRWFTGLTEAEKSDFIDATMPTGFKQMLESFEQMPVESRQRAVENSLRRLRQAQNELARESNPGAGADTPNPPPLSPELQEKVVTIGLKSFYSESSAQTKAELAPVLEEMQRLMERGSLFRGERRR